MLYDELFTYSDGMLLYKVRRGKMRSGSIAGTLCKGYVQIKLGHRFIGAHRVIWEMFNGAIPYGMQIDHINHIRNDNRLENLRLVTPKDNSRNMSIKINNTSSINGVHFDARYLSKWRATIRVNGVRLTLGSFNTKEDAVIARKNAEITHNFHKNHGGIK